MKEGLLYWWNFYLVIAHGLQRSAELHKSGTQVPKTKHNPWQGKFHSTATFHSDQSTHSIATECGIQLPGLKTPKMNLIGISLQSVAISISN